MCGFYEDLEKGVTCKSSLTAAHDRPCPSLHLVARMEEGEGTPSGRRVSIKTNPGHLSVPIKVFRAGEQGRFWYAVLGGSLEVRYHGASSDNDSKVSKRCQM